MARRFLMAVSVHVVLGLSWMAADVATSLQLAEVRSSTSSLVYQT